MTNTEYEAEKIARELAKADGKPALWELYVPVAYGQMFAEADDETDSR